MRIGEGRLRLLERTDWKKSQTLSLDQALEIRIRQHDRSMPARLQGQSETDHRVHVPGAAQGR